MNELRRLAYLEAMDIPSYVSRCDLPGAQPSRRLRLRPPAVVSPAADDAVAAEPAAPRQVPAGARAALASNKPAASAAPERQRRPAADVPVFTVVATEAGGWLWLDEIPAGRDPGPAYPALLGAICRALGLTDVQPSLQLFNYPVAVGAALEAGVEGAREALYGFLMARVARTAPARIVLLGRFDQSWFDRSCLDGVPVTETESAFAMLRQPALKARAWETLRPLAQR
ncbi:MAG: hypothetical protein V2J89_02330 [Halieaceae bacterium]|jgi:hypothetical protein|nr:hypothetical protein [Halieaceae bacterium]